MIYKVKYTLLNSARADVVERSQAWYNGGIHHQIFLRRKMTMARTESVTLTNMCMVYSGTRVLVLDRTDPAWHGITFPGGHVEKGESFTDAVIREVFEETGLRIVSPQLCGIKDWMKEDGSRYMVLLYKTNRFTGEPKSSDEGEVYWAELADLPALPLADSMAGTLQVFLNDDLSEDYYYMENGIWAESLK